MLNSISSLPNNPKQIVGFRKNQPINLEELNQRIFLWKQELQKISGNKIAIYIEDSLEFMAVLFATLEVNKIPYLPSNALKNTAETLSKIVDKFVGEFSDEFSPLKTPQTLENIDISPISFSPQQELVIFTSGSTGEPKAITKRISQLLNEITVLEKTFGKNIENLKVYATVSHSHIYGILFKVFWAFYTQKPIIAESLNFPEELAEIISKEQIILISSPAHLKRFATSDVLDGFVPAIFSSGGVLDKETALSIKELLKTSPYEIYGSSETGGIAWRNINNADYPYWKAFEGIELKSNPENNSLEIKSNYLYDNDWFKSADIVEFKNNNTFILKGRVDRIVKLEEERVSLTAMETKLKASNLVKEAKIMLMEKENRQVLAAFVVLTSKGENFLDTNSKLQLNNLLRDFLKESFELVVLPKIWRYLKEFPYNKQGKIAYSDLMALL